MPCMFAPRNLLAACALLACIGMARSRVLHQTGSLTDFTSSNNTYLVSTALVGSEASDTAEACMSQCLEDSSCMYWSWCPTSQSAGCTIPGLAGEDDVTLPAKSCVLSYDKNDDQLAVYAVNGASVATMGGRWNPSNMAPSTPAGTPPDPSNPASWIDPAGTPAECTGWFTGNQWQGDEIECHVCNGDYQLKCDLDTDLFGDDSVKCEFDAAGVGALVNNAIEFDCVVDFSKVPQNQCNWDEVAAKLPSCAVEPVRRIMATWRPDE